MLASQPHLVRKIRAAITAKIKPTSMVLMEDPSKPWRILDYQLLEAYDTLESEICPQCSNPIWLCRSKDNELQFKVHRDVCRASARLDEDEWRENNKGKTPSREDRLRWGQIKYTKPFTIKYPGEEQKPLPTREEFYESLKDLND